MKRTKSRKLYFKTALLFDSPEGKVIKVKFPWNVDTLTEVKGINGRQWYDKGKYWTIPLNLENCEIINTLGFKLRGDLIKWARRAWQQEYNPITKVEIPELGGVLFPYQVEGVAFLENFDGRGLIADEMGLGKTIQALAWLQLHLDKRPVIIVCPASLKLNWKREILHWMTIPSIEILSGTTCYPLTSNMIIINYDILTHWVVMIQTIKPQVIILDESHYIKNSKTKRTKAVKKLCKGVPHLIALSGTPIENKPIEIFNTINLIDSSVFPNQWQFAHRYCDAKHNGYGWDFNGSSNVEELHEKLSNKVMIRRKKADVLPQLPDKIYSFIPLEITNRKEYASAEYDFIQYVRSGVEIEARKLLAEYLSSDLQAPVEINDHKLKRLQDEKAEKATALTQIEALKQLAAKGKLDSIISWIEDFLESGEKLVVFATHKFVIQELMTRFKKLAVKIDGSVSMDNRQKAVDTFQNNSKIKLFVGNIKAAGVGITLTAASNVAIIEYPWTPGELVQAIDRCHRIGQKDTVNVHYLMAVDTIEEKIAHMLDDKQKVLDAVLDGKQTNTGNLLGTLINNYK